jgi:hypothetical protein
MIEAVSTSETSLNFYTTTWCNITEDSHLQQDVTMADAYATYIHIRGLLDYHHGYTVDFIIPSLFLQIQYHMDCWAENIAQHQNQKIGS